MNTTMRTLKLTYYTSIGVAAEVAEEVAEVAEEEAEEEAEEVAEEVAAEMARSGWSLTTITDMLSRHFLSSAVSISLQLKSVAFEVEKDVEAVS